MIVVQVNLKTLERKVIEEYAHPNDISDDALANLIAKYTMACERKANKAKGGEQIVRRL